MAGGESSFAAVATFCEELISQKEAPEKAREGDLGGAPTSASFRSECGRWWSLHVHFVA